MKQALSFVACVGAEWIAGCKSAAEVRWSVGLRQLQMHNYPLLSLPAGPPRQPSNLLWASLSLELSLKLFFRAVKSRLFSTISQPMNRELAGRLFWGWALIRVVKATICWRTSLQVVACVSWCWWLL